MSTQIELHYWFDDISHTIDASIQNKCEREFLAIVKEISECFGVDIEIETEPLGNGGLKRWYKIIAKKEHAQAIIITGVLINILSAPITAPISTLLSKQIEYIYEDTELKELEKQELREKIRKLQIENNKSTIELEKSTFIKKRRSNFYEFLNNYNKVCKVGFNENLKNGKIIEKSDFKNYILTTDDLPEEIIENATIEIISPVLKKGNYKWMGVFNGNIIHFNMKSWEFKSLVENGKVEFKNGTSIDCQLTISKKVDSEGKEIITGYNVFRVNSYFENDTPIETYEGVRHKKKIESEENQLGLF